jgi:hypothetical protein
MGQGRVRRRSRWRELGGFSRGRVNLRPLPPIRIQSVQYLPDGLPCAGSDFFAELLLQPSHEIGRRGPTEIDYTTDFAAMHADHRVAPLLCVVRKSRIAFSLLFQECDIQSRRRIERLPGAFRYACSDSRGRCHEARPRISSAPGLPPATPLNCVQHRALYRLRYESIRLPIPLTG